MTDKLTPEKCPERQKNRGKFDGNYHCSHCGKAFRIQDQAEFLTHQANCDYVCLKRRDDGIN